MNRAVDATTALIPKCGSVDELKLALKVSPAKDAMIMLSYLLKSDLTSALNTLETRAVRTLSSSPHCYIVKQTDRKRFGRLVHYFWVCNVEEWWCTCCQFTTALANGTIGPSYDEGCCYYGGTQPAHYCNKVTCPHLITAYLSDKLLDAEHINLSLMEFTTLVYRGSETELF